MSLLMNNMLDLFLHLSLLHYFFPLSFFLSLIRSLSPSFFFSFFYFFLPVSVSIYFLSLSFFFLLSFSFCVFISVFFLYPSFLLSLSLFILISHHRNKLLKHFLHVTKFLAIEKSHWNFKAFLGYSK